MLRAQHPKDELILINGLTLEQKAVGNAMYRLMLKGIRRNAHRKFLGHRRRPLNDKCWHPHLTTLIKTMQRETPHCSQAPPLLLEGLELGKFVDMAFALDFGTLESE